MMRWAITVATWVLLVSSSSASLSSAHPDCFLNGQKHWKLHGPDLDGGYGGLQGIGGLEAVIRQSDGSITPLISDAFGNVVAGVSGTNINWNPTRVGGYGPLPGSSAAWLSTNTTLAAATVWRGKRMDPTGYYWQGARYYDPVAGRFLSPDPLGHEASMDLYSYADGDPINLCDPDGRFGKNTTSSQLTMDSSGAYSDSIAPYVSALKSQAAIDSGNDPEGWARQQYYAGWLRTAVGVVPGVNLLASYVEAVNGRELITGRELTPVEAMLNFGMTAGGMLGMARMGVTPAEFSSVSPLMRPAGRMEIPTLARGSAATPKATQLEFGFVNTLTPKKGTKVYRVYGRNANRLGVLDPAGANPWGKSWTTIDPRTVPNYRMQSGIWPRNAGRFVIEGRLNDVSGVTRRTALPGPDGVGAVIEELLIPDAKSRITPLNVQGLNPQF